MAGEGFLRELAYPLLMLVAITALLWWAMGLLFG